MRYFAVFVLMNLLGAASLPAATLPIYFHDDELNVPPDPAPTIDATRVVIGELFNINIPTPYQTLNTLFYTNTGAGLVRGFPGFRYDFFTNNSRRMMDTWVNQGTNSGTTWLMVWATNIHSTGPIMAGPSGLVKLEGKNISLVRNGLRAGLEPGAIYGEGFAFIGSTQYVNAVGISDLYWGSGTNNFLNNQGNPMPLGLTNAGFPGSFNVPCTISPQHQVHDTRFIFGGGGTFTNFVTVPDIFFGFGGTCFKQFDAHAYTATLSATSRLVQVVFVSRNLFDTNFTTQVRFVPDLFDIGRGRVDAGLTAMIEFGSVERDLITGLSRANTVYFIDRSAFTNATLARNIFTTTRKPNVFEVRRSTPFGFDTNSSFAANTPYSPSLLYDSTFASNEVNVSYAAYRFRLASTGETNLFGVVSRHPTNTPGRVEIIGENINLDRTRIRAESTAIIRARNLTGNAARVDAPFCSYDLGSSSPPLVFTNLAPPVVQRLSGEISAWSAIWDNYETNATGTNLNLVRFHVLIVDNELQALQPVAITELALRSPHVVLSDPVTVRDSFFTDATSLHIVSGLNLPLGSNWRSNNVPNLLNLTNDGNLSIPGVARFGSDRPGGYANFINRGTNVARSHFVRAQRVENTGCIIANSGVLSIDAGTMNVQGGPWSVSTNLFTNTFIIGNATFTNIFFAVVTNIPGKIQGHSDVQIIADDFSASDSYIRAGAGAVGALSLSIGSRLTDGGPGTSNYWAVSAGFQLNQRPAAGGDLFGTHIVSLAAPEQEVFHTWPAEDRGNSVSGFNNNLALGKLTLDGAPTNVFHFNPPTGQSSGAIYVDYLELLNNATNYNETVNAPINIGPNMRIYFANANIAPSKLDGRIGGRLIWVKNYFGALSTTNIVYPSPPYPTGTVVRANVALATSRDDDSDGDTIVNADDLDPFFINQSVGLRIETSKSGDALLSWNALAEAANLLECTADLQAVDWRTVTNFVQGDLTTRVTVRDSLSTTNQRIYRVRVTPP